MSCELSAIGRELSAFSHQLSAISFQPSAKRFQLSAIGFQLDEIHVARSSPPIAGRRTIRIIQPGRSRNGLGSGKWIRSWQTDRDSTVASKRCRK
jgi:hypothetical protein